MNNYLLADFVARLNVAKRKHFKTIRIKPSNIIFSLLRIFEELGIIRGYFILETYEIEILLKYTSSRCAFSEIEVISKPSKRIYVDLLNLNKLKEKNAGSILILSTSKGYMLDIECLKEHLGGVVFLKINF